MMQDEITVSTPASALKRARGNPDKPLRKACAKALREHSDAIAKSLLDHGLDGNVQCLKLLTFLGAKDKSRQPKPPEPEPPKPKRSLATEWANEPEWVDPEDEPSAL